MSVQRRWGSRGCRDAYLLLAVHAYQSQSSPLPVYCKQAKDAATSIGNKLKRRLERGRERGLGDGDGDDDDNGAGGNGGLPNKCAAGAGMKWASVGSQSAGGAAGTSGRPVAAAAAAAAVRGGGGNADDSDSDSEDGGRAAALCRSSRQSQPQVETARQPGHQRHQQGPGASWAAAGPAPRRQGFTRNDLLALSSAYQQEADAQPGYQREGQGKKKKKKNKGAKGGNATVP